jgi:hypothetical protein
LSFNLVIHYKDLTSNGIVDYKRSCGNAIGIVKTFGSETIYVSDSGFLIVKTGLSDGGLLKLKLLKRGVNSPEVQQTQTRRPMTTPKKFVILRLAHMEKI